MKYLAAVILLLSFVPCFSQQQEEFLLEGQVTDSTKTPLADAYIINTRTQQMAVSKSNGIFAIRVLPADSLVLIHLAYIRKTVKVFALLKNPVVELTSDNINIAQVDVSPGAQSDYERARRNVAGLAEIKPVSYSKIDPNPQPVMQMMTENNRIMKTQASSVSVLRFSPSEQIGKLLKKWKKNNHK